MTQRHLTVHKIWYTNKNCRDHGLFNSQWDIALVTDIEHIATFGHLVLEYLNRDKLWKIKVSSSLPPPLVLSFPPWYISISFGSANLSPAFAFTLLFAYGFYPQPQSKYMAICVERFHVLSTDWFISKKIPRGTYNDYSCLKDEKLEKRRNEVIVPTVTYLIKV